MASLQNFNNDNGDCPSPSAKRAKFAESTQDSHSIHTKIKDLSSFKLEKVLSNNTNRKTLFLHGKFDSEEGDAVLLLEKTAFTDEKLTGKDNYFTEKSFLEQVFHNDIYGDYQYFPMPELNAIKTTIIHPATEKHIIKYTTQDCYILDETPKIYKEIVLPHINKEQLNLQWVYNILEHKSEVDRIIFEDTDPDVGFILLPDLKWNGESNTLYLLAIVNKHGIRSIRDLTESHLPLLDNIKIKGVESIKSRFGLDESQLRIYLHYQPSFYHLHVHFCCLKHEAPGILAERAHLLSHVISNIELLPDYYQKVTLPYTLRTNDNLFKKLVDSKIIGKNPYKNDANKTLSV